MSLHFDNIIYKNVDNRESINEFRNKVDANSHKLLVKFSMN